MDECDPTSFNAVLGESGGGFCHNVALATFGYATVLSDLLMGAENGTPDPGWDFEPDQLTNKIKDKIAARVDKRVYVRSDARAKYKSVVDVVDNVRAAGVDDLGLLTEQKQQNRRNAPTAPTPVAGGSE